MKHLIRCLAALLACLALGCTPEEHPIKIGFVVKQPEEPWFQDEWRFADQAAREHGFELVKIGAPDGEKVMNAIDNLAAQGAQGLVICVPDVRLGPALVARSAQYGLKLMTVDDQLLDGTGTPIAAVPHMGLSAYEIGRQVGAALVEEAARRGWNLAEVGALRIAFDQLPTARERTRGASDALVEAGLPAGNIIAAPQARSDTEQAFTAADVAITAHPEFRHWLAYGMNDEAVLGAVRAGEGRGFDAARMIGVGIGGSRSADNEFSKAQPTAFLGTVLISPKRHGYEATMNMYRWIVDDQAPPPLVLTTGLLMTRGNQAEVRAQMGL